MANMFPSYAKEVIAKYGLTSHHIKNKNLKNITEDQFNDYLESGYNLHNLVTRGSNDDILMKAVYEQIMGLNIRNDIISIQKSSIHGLGVFATENIKKGQIITFYPVNSYGTTHTKIYSDTGVLDENYKITLGNLMIYGNPNQTDNKLFLGHMVNDSASFEINKNASNKQIKNAICRYILESKNNALMKSDKHKSAIYHLATKDILKGEEILSTYTPTFWLKTPCNQLKGDNLRQTDINFRKYIQIFAKSLID
jgi:SET domain-containing protein